MADKVKAGRHGSQSGIKTPEQQKTIKGPGYPESSYTPWTVGDKSGDKGPKVVG